jgi:dihydropyrimidine dehydrogenase (NAD+) subunit PreT
MVHKSGQGTINLVLHMPFIFIKFVVRIVSKEEFQLKDNKRYLKKALETYTHEEAIAEASRCLKCEDAPCAKACPAGINPLKYIKLILDRDFDGAADSLRRDCVIGGACANVCPSNTLCERACAKTGITEAIHIGRLEHFVSEHERANRVKAKEAEKTKEKVAVIGGGPAGLSAAGELARKGYQVTIFEGREKAGGWLRYGIPPVRIPEEVVDSEVDYIKSLGVEIITNCKVGKDITIDELKEKEYKAFIIATGLQKARKLRLQGADLEGVIGAVEYLAEVKPNKGNVDVGENVVIIGSGDVGMDCATTPLLLGAKTATILNRGSIKDVTANPKELSFAQELGANLICGFSPAEIIGKDGKVVGFKAVAADGESYIYLKADKVIFAVGQIPENLKEVADIELNDRGLVVIDEKTGQSSIPYIFAAGDIARGPRTVTHAAGDGKLVADSVDKYLSSLR